MSQDWPGLGSLLLGSSLGYCVTHSSSCQAAVCCVLGFIAFPLFPVDYNCGGLLDRHYGNFSSPFYPGNYPNNARCVWNILVPTNNRVTLTFRDVQ